MAKNAQNWSKIGQKSAKIETEAGRDGGWYPPPYPQGSKKSAIRAIFYKVKTETGPRFLGGQVPPTPWGPKVALYTHTVVLGPGHI